MTKFTTNTVSVFAILLSGTLAQGQELARVPSNFDVNVWARPVEFPPSFNHPYSFGQFPAPCSFSHLKYDDPIQKPGQAGAAPLHVFFGNTTANASSTYQSLRSNGDGTCIGGPLNRSAYFMPAMINAQGKVVLPDFLDVFFRGDSRTRPFPRGLKIIFGFNEANPTAPWDLLNPITAWSFGDGGAWQASKAGWGEQLRFQTLDVARYPEWAWKNNSYGVSVRLVAPNCWNGTSLDSADHRSHMAYAARNLTTGIMTCPVSHPVMVPEVVLTAYYRHISKSPAFPDDDQYWRDNRSDAAGWYLSSDKFAGRSYPSGTNIYAGMIAAWDDDIMTSWVTNILNPGKFGSMSKLGDGRILAEPTTSRLYPPTAFKPYFLWSLKTTPFMGAPQGYSNNNLIDKP